MTTKDAVAILLTRTWADSVDDQAENIAPVFERVLRAAFDEGFKQAEDNLGYYPEEVLAVGVAAMVEK